MADDRQDELGKVFSFEAVTPAEANCGGKEESREPDEPFTIPAFLRRTAKKTEQPQVTPIWRDDDFARIAATAETPKRDEACVQAAQAPSADADTPAETASKPDAANAQTLDAERLDAETPDDTASVVPVESDAGTPPSAVDEREISASPTCEETAIATARDTMEPPPAGDAASDVTAASSPSEISHPDLGGAPLPTQAPRLLEEPVPSHGPHALDGRFVSEPIRVAEARTFRPLTAERFEAAETEPAPEWERVEPRFGPVGARKEPVRRRSPWQGKDFPAPQIEMDDSARWRLGPALDGAEEIEAFSDDPHKAMWMREDGPRPLRWVLLAFIVAAGGYAIAHQLDNPETVAALLPSIQKESGVFGPSSEVPAKAVSPAAGPLASASPTASASSTPTIVPTVPAPKPAASVERKAPVRQDKVAQADEPARPVEQSDDRARTAAPVTLAPGPHPLSASPATQPYPRMRFVKGPDPITPP
jgi:hypothetical protein